MRSTRWLLLLAIFAVLGGTGALYRLQKRLVKSSTPAKPASLPLDTNNLAFDYEYQQSSGGNTKFKVRAKKFKQVGDTTLFELEGVELELSKEPTHFDLIKCASARFDQAQAKMYTDAEVEITLDVPVTGKPLHPLTSIKTSGVNFDSKTGKASSDKATSFQFANGHGICIGAVYDPNIKELHLLHGTDLTLEGNGPKSKPMRVQSEELTYKEGSSVVLLSPWAKMHRDRTDMDAAGPATIHLKENQLDSIDAEKGHGTDRLPTRQLDYAANMLHMQYLPNGDLQKVSGVGSARLNSTTAMGQTNMNGNSVDLDFNEQDGEATLAHVLANGNAVVETKPAPGDGKAPVPETKVLRSNTVEVQMRPNGREIDHVQTHAPGVLEFLPNEPKQHHRLVTGERMTITYAQQNQIQSFQSVNVTTETLPAAVEKRKDAKPSKTASVHMTAEFDPQSGQMKQMKQWDHFTYEEGDRRATSMFATFEQDKDVMNLDEHARVWDSTGSTDGDKIVLNQKTDDFSADGHVSTTRLPDKKKNSSDLLDSDQPTQGQSRRMTSTRHNKLVHYEGDAVLWQEANRVQGDVIDVDRDNHRLTATGNVTSTFLDTPAQDKAATPAAGVKAPEPVFTMVRAPKMVYTESTRLADYTGGVKFDRPGLTVSSQELKAWLNPSDAKQQSKINHADADGRVEIIEDTPQHQRKGTGEHSEYYTADERILLRGGEPELVDNKKGTTRGAELTYFTNDDRLLVTGEVKKPVKSVIHRKHAVS
jgi:lipopolysaccharide export system protein LptA